MLKLDRFLKEMTDLSALAEFPDPAYKTIQFASYDRRSVNPYEDGWYANEDGFGGEPLPNFEATIQAPDESGNGIYLIGEVNCPGVIVRMWTAHIKGRIQLFLDGETTPTYDGNAHDFLVDPFKSMGGADSECAGFSQRAAGYFPIPFSKSCRIVWHGNIADPHFYAVQLRCYAAEVQVERFQPEHLKTYASAISSANQQLEQFDQPAALASKSIHTQLKPQACKTIHEASDPSQAHAIKSLSIQAQADHLGNALRQTILRIYFDHSPSPQVESPLGDFFGAGPGINPFHTLPMSVEPDGTMRCNFVMPYKSHVRVTLENWSEGDVDIHARIQSQTYQWHAGRSMHFFAKWRADHGLLAKHRGEDCELPFLCTRGKGCLVGIASIMVNPTSCPTRHGGWWGEGDEKIWVDDDTFPSTFGTGSEDYYNYAWSSDALFHHPYFAQPQATGPANRGYVSNNRWHILDPLPFTSSLAFFMELITHLETPDFSYARLAYFYGFPSMRDGHVPLRPAVTYIPKLPAWKPIAEKNTGTEGAIFHLADELNARCTQGELAIQQHDQCAGGHMLLWTGGQPGDQLTIRLPIQNNEQSKGTHKFSLVCHANSTAGKIEIHVDNQPISEVLPVIDLHRPHTEQLQTIQGERELCLDTGEHELTITLKDKQTHLGLNFLWVISV